MALQFPKQLRGAGIKKPIVGSGVSYDEFVLPFMGDEVIGDVSALHYGAGINTPENEKFVKAYRAKYGKMPGYYSENNYSTAMWFDEAMKKKYELGTELLPNVVRAAQDLISAENNVVSQQIQLRRSILTLLTATGELLDERGIVIQ